MTDINDKGFNFPIYAIEVARFLRVIRKINTVRFSLEELKDLASGCSCLFNNEKHGDYIIYDKFLLAVRGATMTKEEIKVQMNYIEPEDEPEPV